MSQRKDGAGAELRDQVQRDLEENYLEPWEKELIRWVALQVDRREYFRGDTVRAKFLRYATALAERHIGQKEMRRRMRRPAWLRFFQEQIETTAEGLLKEAKLKAVGLIPKGLDIYDKALTRVEETLDSGDVRMQLEGARLTSNLAGPLLDRAIPKREQKEVTQATIQINLSASQLAALERSSPSVEIIEGVAEVIEEPPRGLPKPA